MEKDLPLKLDRETLGQLACGTTGGHLDRAGDRLLETKQENFRTSSTPS